MNQSLVDIVCSALKGARLGKFNASIIVLNESLAQGAWINRGAVKAESGFYQGLANVRADEAWDKANVGTPEWDAKNAMEFSLRYGQPLRFRKSELSQYEQAKLGIKILREHGNLKLSEDVITAWLALIEEKRRAYTILNDARPLPKITPIGLSPKVTATLKEMNLNLDLSSIRMAKIVAEVIQLRNPETLEWENHTVHIVRWTPGIVHNKSRFASGGHCHACGKNIPSRRFVPVEAMDLNSKKLVSMWLGCDCAKNIFGIKDVGLERPDLELQEQNQ